MSEHTKGLLHQCSHSDKRVRDEIGKWVLDTDTAYRSDDECTANARRLAACWNAFENVRTELVELTVGSGAMQAAADAMEKLPAVQSELAAARALLREFLAEVDSYHQLEWHVPAEGDAADKVRSYLDACDTLGGNSEVGS